MIARRIAAAAMEKPVYMVYTGDGGNDMKEATIILLGGGKGAALRP